MGAFGNREHYYLSFQPGQINATNNLALENQEHENWRNTGKSKSSNQIINGRFEFTPER